MRRTICLLVAVALPVCAAHVASAQTKPNKAKLRAAKNHYKRASAYQDLGQYQKAAASYMSAYKLYPHPEFLFNVAEVNRLDGAFEQALKYYKKYLTLDPNGRGAATSRIHVAMLENKVAELRAKRSRGKKPGDKDKSSNKPGGSQTKRDTRAKTKASGTSTEPKDGTSNKTAEVDAPPVVVPGRRGRKLRLAGLGTAGFGVLSLALGMKFGLDARSISNQVETANPWDQDLYDRGKAKQRNMYIMYGLGTVALAAGGALYYFGRKAGREDAARRRVTVTPHVDSSTIGVVVGGRY